MPPVHDSQGKRYHKPKSKQYFFINETRLCGSLASPLISQTNLVYNNQITCWCFCGSKGGTWEDSAQQAPPVSAPTWHGLFWSLNSVLHTVAGALNFTPQSLCTKVSSGWSSSYCGDLDRVGTGVVQIRLMCYLFQGCCSPSMEGFKPMLLRKGTPLLLQLSIGENSNDPHFCLPGLSFWLTHAEPCSKLVTREH